MAIPLSYNVRNLLGITLTVATAVFIMALLAGLNRAFGSTGDPLNVLILRKGSDSELPLAEYRGSHFRSHFKLRSEIPRTGTSEA